MTDEKQTMDSSREDTRVEINIQGDEKSGEKDHETLEKHPEKMTKSELIEKVRALQEKSAENFDLYLRSQAEMENVRKRSKKEKEDWVKYANETLIKEILPVMDNLENALSHSNNENSLHALREGIALTLKGLKDSLAKAGVEEVKAKGEPFDPCFHEAVSELEDPDTKPGIVVHELQRGYVLNQRLIRPAMVVVSRGGQTDSPNDHRDSTEKACEE